MWYLLLQILPLLVISAILGAALANWWFKNHYEDVSESHAQLMHHVGRIGDVSKTATRDDLDASMALISSSVAALRMPDLEPVQARLEGVERAVTSFALPPTDFTPLEQRLDLIESSLLSPNQDIGDLGERLDSLERAVNRVSNSVTDLREPDLHPVETRLGRLEESIRNFSVPQTDLGPIHSGLAVLEQTINSLEMPTADLTPIQGQIRRIESKLDGITSMSSSVAALRMPDLEPVHERLFGVERALSNIVMPEADLEPMQQRLENVERSVNAVASMVAELHNTDTESLETHVMMLSEQVEKLRLPDIDPLQQRIYGLETAIANFEVPEVDLGPVHQRLGLMEANIISPRQDFEALHDRLSSIEGTIAGLDRSIPAPIVDTSGMDSRIASMEAALRSFRTDFNVQIPSLEPLEQQVAGLQNSVLGLKHPDLGAVENRLSAIEYSLAAVHQMVRGRLDTAPAIPAQVAPPTVQYNSISEPLVRFETRPRPELRLTETIKPLAEAPPSNGRRGNLLAGPDHGTPDNLELLHGVGPGLRNRLNDIGVYYFWQIAEWSPEEAAWVDSQLEPFQGRIHKDSWVSHARTLAAQPGAASRPV